MTTKVKKLLKTALIAVCLPAFALTGTAQQELVLSPEQAKEHAVTYNRSLQKAGLSIEEAQESLWQTIAEGLPKIDAVVDYSNYLGFEMSLAGQKIAFNPTSNAKLTVSQLIFSGQYWVGVEMSKIAKKLTEKSVVKTELDVKESVINSYYAILLVEQSRIVLSRNLENMRDIHKRTEDMALVELVEKTDAEQISVQVLNIEAALRSLDRQEELAFNMLKLQLGVAPDTKIKLTAGIDELVNAVSLQALAGKGFSVENNIDFQLLKTREELSKKQIEMNKAAYLPSVAGFYSYTYKLKKPAFDMSPANMVGLQANIPIFSSFARRAKVRQSQIQLKSLQKDIEQAEDQLNIQEKQLKFNLQTAYDQYVIQQKNAEVSKRVLESNSRKHEHGLISTMELTTANTNYLQAENSLLTAKNDLLKAQTELLKLTGAL